MSQDDLEFDIFDEEETVEIPQKEGLAKIEDCLKEVFANLAQAKVEADKHLVTFNFVSPDNSINYTYHGRESGGYWENNNEWDDSGC